MDEIKALIEKVEILFEKEQYQKVVDLLSDVVLEQCKSSDLYVWRAWAHNKLNETEKAFEISNKAVAIDPLNSFAYRNRGVSWAKKGDYDKASAEFSKAIELKNDDAISYYNIGLLWHHKDNPDKAIAHYDKAIELKMDYADAYNNRGVALEIKGDLSKAIENFSKAIEFKSGSSLHFKNRGNAYIRTGDYEKAIADFQKAISLDARNFDYLDNQIKLAKEKLEERKRIEGSAAKPNDKLERKNIETDVDKLISLIRDASKSTVQTVVHYTKVFVVDLYVKTLEAKMQYSNAIYMNDPMEGKIIFEYLDDEEITTAYVNGEKRTETSVYLGSFLPAEDDDGELSHEDELVMWRTYGKDEHGKEAAGGSVVLSSNFFKMRNLKEDSSSSVDTDEELLNVVYVKRLRHSKKLTNDKEGRIEKAMIDLKKQLLKLIKLRDKNKANKDFHNGIENSIFKSLSKISYLFKSADFQYEHEVRVITYMARDSSAIKYKKIDEPHMPPKRFFIESYNHILPYIKKIYLGPKVEQYQQWSLYLDYELRQRAAELKDMQDKAPYNINPSDMEIIKSENKFQ